MKALLEFIDGRKTYAAILGIWLLLFCYWQGWIKLPADVAGPLTSAAIQAVPLAFLRSAISKLQNKTE